METKSWNIRLDAISVSTTNEMFRSSGEMTDKALQDLVSSIEQLGVIQPILVRPCPGKKDHYIIISGERRYRASKLAGKTDIPAYIKDVNEGVALLMQIAENMQREDIHPLNEAKGYKMIMDGNPGMTTTELALKFGKSETYILQRLKLNDLVKEGKRDFHQDKMTLGHALLLARLTPQDQREAINRISNQWNGYGTVNDLRQFIETNIMNSLSQAPFKLDDPELYRKAGACVNCAKHSGASPLLFSEIREKDKCFDRTCFFIKWQRFLLKRTKEVIETHPDIVLLTGYYQVAEEIGEILAKHNITPLKEYDDFSDRDNGGKKVKGLWLSGTKAGKTVTVYLKKKARELSDKEDETSVIAKIQHRIKRAKELDGEKVYGRILENLKNHPTQKRGCPKKLMPDEETMLWYVIFDRAGYALKRELAKVIGVKKETSEELYSRLKKLRPESKAFLLRKVMLDQYGGNYPASAYGFIIRKIAEGYGDIDIASFEKEQKEIREKREARARDRIQLLRKEVSKKSKAK